MKYNSSNKSVRMLYWNCLCLCTCGKPQHPQEQAQVPLPLQRQFVNILGKCLLDLKKYLSKNKSSHSRWNTANGGVASSALFFCLSALKDIPADTAPFQPSAIWPQKMMLLQLSVDCKTQTNKNCSDFPESILSQNRHAQFSYRAECNVRKDSKKHK